MKKADKKRIINTLGILSAVVLVGLIGYFAFTQSFIGKVDVYDSDFYSVGTYSITLNPRSGLDPEIVDGFGADLKDNRVDRYDIIWANEGRSLSTDCLFTATITNPSDASFKSGDSISHIGGASLSNGILRCNIQGYPNEHFKDKIMSPQVVFNFIVEETTPEETTQPEETQDTEDTQEAVQCVSNIECQIFCDGDTPTCSDNVCFCSGEQLTVDVSDETPIYFYILPVSLLIVIALIIWGLIKKPKRRK